MFPQFPVHFLSGFRLKLGCLIHLSDLVPSQAHLHIAVPSVEVISDSVVTLRDCRQRFRFLRVVGSSELSKKQDIIDLSDLLESTSLGRLSLFRSSV